MTAPEVQKQRDKEKIIKQCCEWWKDEMEAELLKPENLKKPVWRESSDIYLIIKIEQKIIKLAEHICDGIPLKDETAEQICADISNYAMMIADKVCNPGGVIKWRKKVNPRCAVKDYVS